MQIVHHYLNTFNQTTILFVTHNLEEAFSLCNKGLLLKDGKLFKTFDFIRENKQDIKQEIWKEINEDNQSITQNWD